MSENPKAPHPFLADAAASQYAKSLRQSGQNKYTSITGKKEEGLPKRQPFFELTLF